MRVTLSQEQKKTKSDKKEAFNKSINIFAIQ